MNVKYRYDIPSIETSRGVKYHSDPLRFAVDQHESGQARYGSLSVSLRYCRYYGQADVTE